MDDILSYESAAERDDCISPVFGYSTGSSDTSVGFGHLCTSRNSGALTCLLIFVVIERGVVSKR